MSVTRELIFNVEAPGLDGLLKSFSSELRAPDPVVAWGDGEQIALRPVRLSTTQERLFDDAFETGMQMRVTVSTGQKPPTGGEFTLIIRNTSTDFTSETTPLPYNATISAVAAAINVQCNNLSMLDVTVEESGNDYLVYSRDLSFAIEAGNDALIPECAITPKQLRQPTTERDGVWRVRVLQVGIAYAAPTTAYDTLSSTITATSTQAGTSTQSAIQTFNLSPVPYGGNAKWTAVVRQVVDVTCLADTAGDRNNTVAFTLQDSSGPVQVYLNNGTGSPPSAPAGGRNVAVSYASGDSSAVIARKIFDAIRADSALTAFGLSEASLLVSSPVAGIGNGTFTVTRIREARSITALLPYTSSPEKVMNALDGAYTIERPSAGVWIFTATDSGVQSSISLDTSALLVPKGAKGTLSYDTIAAQEAFVATTEDSIKATLSIEIEYLGEEPKTALMIPCIVKRDFVTSESGNTPASWVGTQTATVNITAGAETVTWTFTNAFTATPSLILHGAVRKNEPDDDSPPFIVGESSRSATQVVLNLSASAPANCKVDLLAIP